MKYFFYWKNNSKRAKLRGKKCDVLIRGAKGSILIVMEDGEKVVTSWRALRKLLNAEI